MSYENKGKYALVLVNIKGLGVKTFGYLIPDEIKDKIMIGQAVRVPFGRQGLIKAFVVGFSDYMEEGINPKKIRIMKTTKYLFAGLLMLSVSTQSFAQDAKKVDELTKIIAENKNNPAATKAVVKNYMKLNKKDAVAVAALGKAFLNLDDMTNATEYANLAIKANKHHAAGYLLRGDIAVAKDNGGEAATWYQNAMLMAPNTPEGYIKYARIYQKVDAEGAVATLEKLRTIDPNYLVDAEIGYMYSKNGQLQKAVEAYDKVRNIESMENYMISDYASS